MGVIVLSLGVLTAALIAAARQRPTPTGPPALTYTSTGAMPSPPPPLSLLQAAVGMAAGTATRAQLREAASLARATGFTALAEQLDLGADVRAALEQAPTDEDQHTSPIPDVSDAAWSTYVKRSVRGDLTEVTPQQRYGRYGFTRRHLHDLQLLTADGWSEACSEAQFLQSPELQYAALVDLTKLHLPLLKLYRSVLGTDIEGQPATRSGLLAVARKAGRYGLQSWVRNPAERAQFSDTTALYRRFNGLF
jgi:hypothetical protein